MGSTWKYEPEREICGRLIFSGAIFLISDPNRKGDWAELRAICWLWDQEYEVFRNAGCTGDVDLIAIKDKEIIKVDVKTIRFTDQGMVFRVNDHEAVLAKGIRLLWVHPDGRVGWNRDYF